MEKFKRLTASVLLILLFGGFVPALPVRAAEIPQEVEPLPPKEGKIELVSKRTLNSKTYLKSDGSKEAVVYQGPVHFESLENGQKTFQEIDYGLNESDSAFGVLFGDTIKNKKNNFNLSISKNLSKNAFSLVKNGTEIAINIADIRNTSKNQSLLNAESLKTLPYQLKENAVSYKGVTPGTDVTFYSMPDGIKEYIALNKYNGQNEFIFSFNLKNGYILADDKGGHRIYNANTKEQVFEMPRFFMWDSKGGKEHIENVYNYDVKTEVTEVKKGSYLIKVKMDEKWLTAKERVFPVYLDPSYSTYSAEDTYVQSGYPTTRAWDQQAIYVGRGESKGINRALVKFNLPDLRGARVDYAQFDVYQYGNCSGSCTWSSVNAYTTGNFNPWDVYWNNQPGLYTHVGNASQTAAYGWLSMNVTGAAQQWFPNYANYGPSYNGALAFYQSVENYWGFRTWASRNNPNYNWGQPKLTINYNDYNAYYEPTTVAEGMAGTTIDVPVYLFNNSRTYWSKGGANPTKIGYHLISNATGEEIVFDGGWNEIPYDIGKGGSGTAIVKVKLPPISGGYTIKYDLVHSGVTWYSHQGVPTSNKIIKVFPPSFASMSHTGQEGYYPMAGPVDLATGNLTYTSTDLSVPSSSGGVAFGRSYNSNINFQVFNHDANGFIRSWLHNGPYKNNDQATRLAKVYIPNENLVRPSNYSTSNNNIWLAASEPTTDYMQYDWVFQGLGAYQRGKALNVAAYSHVYVFSPDNRPAQLRTGSDDGVKAWLNGNLVLNKDVYRGYVKDNDITPVNLIAGWNSLLVKVSQGSGGWNLGARLTTPAGAVMNDLKYSLNNPDLFENPGILGANWTASTEEKLYTVNTEDIYYKDVTGMVNQYIRKTDGSYQTPPGTSLALSKTATNYILTAKDGDQSIFNLSGRILSKKDLSGKMVTYEYENNLVSTITDAGRTLTLSYNQDGTLASIANAIGQSIAYNYDSGRLARVIDNDGYSYKYIYDDQGRLLEYQDKKNNTTKFEYTNNKVSKITDALQFPTNFIYSTAKTEVVDPLSRKSIFTFNSANLLSTFTNAKGYGEKYVHDKRYNKVQTFPDVNGTDPYYYSYAYTYDANDNLILETDPLGAKTTYAYSGNDLIKVVDPKASITEYTYSPDGRRLLLSEKDAEGNVTIFEYDNLGRRTVNISPKLEKTITAFTPFGDIESITSPKGETTSFVYDSVGRKIKDISPLGKENLYFYDNLSRLVKMVSPGDLATEYQYDPSGNKIKEINPNGTFKTWEYDALDRLTVQKDEALAETRYEYDAVGNKAKQIDAKGKATAYQYDELNQLLKEIDVTGVASQVSYDRNGNATAVVDPNGKTMTQTYDKAGQVKSETKPEGTSSYSYDANGNLTTLTSPKENVSVAYNKNNDVTVESSSQTGITTRTYDANQEQTSVKTTNATTEFVYDSNGQVAEVKSTVAPAGIGGGTCTTGSTCPLAVAIPTISGTSNFYRDAEGKILEIGKANGDVVNYGYDIAGRVNSVSTTNKDGVVLASFSYTYDKASNQTEIKDWKGRTLNYEYDVRNQLEKDNLATYRYDIVGNRTEMLTAEGTVGYYYDDAEYGNRLTRVEYPNGRIVTYTYDKNGNATKKIDSVKGTTTYKYNSDDYFVEAIMPDGTKVEYSYDEIENRRTQRKITRPNGGVEITRLTFDGDKLMTETDGSGKILRSYTWDENENLLSVAMPDATGALKFFYFVKNAKGDVLGLSDGSGKLVAEYEYDSWGNILKAETLDSTLGENFAKTNPRLYASYWYDDVLGQYFMKARMYDPEIGRFYSQDALRDLDENLSQNPYIYCSNNPIDRVDPDGKAWLKKAWDWATGKFNQTKSHVSAGLSGAMSNLKNLGSGIKKQASLVPSSIKSAAKAVFNKNNIKAAVGGFAAGVAIGVGLRFLPITAALTPQALGKSGEFNVSRAINMTKNTQLIDMYGRGRIPDFYSRASNFIGEVKNVQYISKTSQIRDYVNFANGMGTSLNLYVDVNTRVSRTIMDLAASGNINLVRMNLR